LAKSALNQTLRQNRNISHRRNFIATPMIVHGEGWILHIGWRATMTCGFKKRSPTSPTLLNEPRINMTAFNRACVVFITTVLMGISSAHAAGTSIKIDNFSFTPDTIEVSVGTTVVWTNGDDIPHAVAATERQFKSHALDTGDSFSYTFSQPGTYPYFCSLHPHMTGKIVVK
jgi:plastocyanin